MKKLAIIVSSIVFAVPLVACNKQVVDVTFSYERAIISLPNGEVVDGKVQSGTNFGDKIQVKIDGVTYLVHSSQAALITGKEGA